MFKVAAQVMSAVKRMMAGERMAAVGVPRLCCVEYAEQRRGSLSWPEFETTGCANFIRDQRSRQYQMPV